jgi:hypothetical protein
MTNKVETRLHMAAKRAREKLILHASRARAKGSENGDIDAAPATSVDGMSNTRFRGLRSGRQAVWDGQTGARIGGSEGRLRNTRTMESDDER